MKEIRKVLRFLEERDLYPDIKVISSPPTPEVIINGRRVISFCSNNYLGLATNPKVIEANIEVTRKYGTGSGASRLVSGTLTIHKQLEEVIAEFKHTEEAIVFSTGYMANLGTITAVMDLINIGPSSFFKRRGVILSDQLNHASIIDGCRFSKAKVVVYEHSNMRNLESKLKRYKKRRTLIVTDGVFSMDGDIVSLPEIVELAREYNALVMVDEAHATGILGKDGAGTVEHFHLEGEIEIIMGTLSKALGGLGGYIAGNKELIKFLRVAIRAHVFTTAMPPGAAAGVIAAMEEIQNNPGLRDRLWKNAEHLRGGLKELGLNTLSSETQIVPVLIGEEKKAIEAARILFERGFFAPCIRWPAVPKNKARIRCTVMATHTEEQIDALLSAFGEIAHLCGPNIKSK
ncbi:MAG: 8-amino-7-oxononanoate synthase [Candidatus Omnitrophica bacterium]|nr:8-amino-7-oxononanoate synthase [Candidatus Omnitrophota bacterium]